MEGDGADAVRHGRAAEVERAAGTATERKLSIDFFQGQLLNLYKQDALSTVREFRDLDDKELRELISVRYVNDQLRVFST